GRINDVHDSTRALGHTFHVTMSGISYQAQLERVNVRAYAPGRLNIQLGLRNLQMVIGGTTITGRRRQLAAAGPVWIVIGHRYPVWLSMDVTPYVFNQQLRLQLVASDFQIPNDNWYVTQPA